MVGLAERAAGMAGNTFLLYAKRVAVQSANFRVNEMEAWKLLCITLPLSSQVRSQGAP